VIVRKSKPISPSIDGISILDFYMNAVYMPLQCLSFELMVCHEEDIVHEESIAIGRCSEVGYGLRVVCQPVRVTH